MNLFILDFSIYYSAAAYYDKHVGKIALELLQMLYTTLCVMYGSDLEGKAWRASAPLTKVGNPGYRPSHENHPLSKWVRSREANFLFCFEYAEALCYEFYVRWGKKHACEDHLSFIKSMNPWFTSNASRALHSVADSLRTTCVAHMPKHSVPPILVGETLTAILNERLKSEGLKEPEMRHAVEFYRMCYLTEKRQLFGYKDAKTPHWMPEFDPKTVTKPTKGVAKKKKTKAVKSS